MIEIEFFKPFCTLLDSKKLTLFFAYKYFIIKKSEGIFDFVPHGSTKIVVNLATKSIDNIDDVFVFKKGEQLIKLPLHLLMLVSNLRTHLLPIIEDTIESNAEAKEKLKLVPRAVREEAMKLIHELEEDNIARLLEKSLLNNDKILFEQLIKLKK